MKTPSKISLSKVLTWESAAAQHMSQLNSTPYNMKIAVCIHLYYPALLEKIVKHTKNIKVPFKTYVNLVEDRFDQSTIDNLNSEFSDLVIIISPNRGVDIGGFLNLLRKVDDDTDLLLKIHTKVGIGSTECRSRAALMSGIDQAARQASNWFDMLMNGVAGSEEQVENILELFQNDPDCGMVGFRLHDNFSPNENEIIKLFPHFGLDHSVFDYKFVGGTIFWCRYHILRKYFTDKVISIILEKMPTGYVPEPSINHALERIFGYIIQKDGKYIQVADQIAKESLWAETF